MDVYSWTGTDRSGTARSGQFAVDAAELPDRVRRRYASGYRTLTVRLGGNDVAGIARHPDTRRRTWWASTESLERDRAQASAAAAAASGLTAHIARHRSLNRIGTMWPVTYHAVLNQPVRLDGFTREAGDTLCRDHQHPFFHLLDHDTSQPVNCPTCQARARRYAVAIRPGRPA